MKRIVILILMLALFLSGCTSVNVDKQKGNTPAPVPGDVKPSSDTGETASVNIYMPSLEESFTERDLKGEIDKSAASTVTFSDSIMYEGDGLSVSENVCRIAAEGVYILSGTSENARIEVNASDKAKIQLVLDGVNLTNPSGSVIFVKSAKKVFITLADGTENYLADTVTYTGGGNEDGVIFSKADLTINGTGKLTVSGNYAHGIVSKDDLVICGGTYDVTAKKSCFSGKDALRISDGTFRAEAGTDAFKSSNSDNAEKGVLLIYGGTYDVHSDGDAFAASKSLMVADGTFNISTHTGSATAVHTDGHDFEKNQDDNTKSAKAFKAGSEILISGGSFSVDSYDDAVHSNGVVQIKGGTLTVNAGDDAIHADTSLVINDGSLNIESCYEGMEAVKITISGGKIKINAKDDGINANGEEHSAQGRLTISGGYLVLAAYGDGIDSNGYINISGGTILVSGPENNGNSALDYGAKGTVTGGTMIICGSSGMSQNFGSESTQCSVLCNFAKQEANTRISCTDKDGNIIVSFAPVHSYSSIVISSPDMAVGEKYVICTGGECDADENGFASSGILTGAESLGDVTLTKTASTFGSGK